MRFWYVCMYIYIHMCTHIAQSLSTYNMQVIPPTGYLWQKISVEFWLYRKRISATSMPMRTISDCYTHLFHAWKPGGNLGVQLLFSCFYRTTFLRIFLLLFFDRLLPRVKRKKAQEKVMHIYRYLNIEIRL